jgi:hypothetical protein
MPLSLTLSPDSLPFLQFTLSTFLIGTKQNHYKAAPVFFFGGLELKNHLSFHFSSPFFFLSFFLLPLPFPFHDDIS